MGLGHSPSIVTSGLVLCLDAGNTKSYPGTGTAWTDLSGRGNTGTLTNGPTFNSYEARTNGNLYSNAVTNGYYTASFVTTGSSSETAPDGTATASYFTLSSTSTTYKGVVGGYITYPTSSIVTISCFVKPTGGARYFWIREGSYGASRVNFDLTSVSVFSSSNATGYINAAGNGWYRVQAVMGALPQNSARVQLLGTSDTTPPGNTNVSSVGTETYHIWGAQCELGAFATSPMLTTSSTVTRSAGPAALVFDGISDYVSTNYSAENTYWSFEYAFYFNAFPSGSGTVCVGKYSGGASAIWSGPNNAISLSINGGTISSGITPTSGNWYIVTCILGADGQRLYVNGSLLATGATTTTSPGSVWTLGSFGPAGGYWLNGRIASFKLYNFALSNEQVLQNYNALRGRFGL